MKENTSAPISSPTPAPHKNVGVYIFIAVLLFLVIGLTGFIVYDKFIAVEESPCNCGDDTASATDGTEDDTNNQTESDSTQISNSTKDISFTIPATEGLTSLSLEITATVPQDTEVEMVGIDTPQPGALLIGNDYTLRVIIPWESYTNTLGALDLVFSSPIFGDVYRTQSWSEDSNVKLYVNEPTLTGTCDFVGDSLPAPCGGPSITAENYIFVATCEGASSDVTICDRVLRSFYVTGILSEI